MHISEVKRMQEEKDHLMRNEGKHPANRNEVNQFDHDNFGGMHGIDQNAHGAELQ